MKFLGGGKLDGDMNKLIKKLIGDDDNQVVVKRWPMKKDWIKETNRLHDEAQKIVDMTKKVKDDGLKLWAKVRIDLDNFGTNLRFNTDTNEVEMVDEPEDKPGIKSPLEEFSL